MFVIVFTDGNQTSDDNFNKNYDGSNLKFIEVNMTDAGTYQCVASSPGFPDAVAETQLNVKGKHFTGILNFVTIYSGKPYIAEHITSALNVSLRWS